MTTTEIGAPAPITRRLLTAIEKPSTIVRLVLALVVVGFLFYFVGPTEIGTTLLKVVIAVGLSVAIFVGANLLFDLAYDSWTLFSTISGFAAGCAVFLLLDSNRALRDIGPRPWLWTLVGGLAVGAVMFLLSAPREQLARLPLAVAGFGGIGVLVAFAVDDDYQPSISWGKLLIATAVGVAVFVGGSLLSKSRSHPRALELSAMGGAAFGWLVGGWGGADLGRGNVGEALLATVPPLVAVGARIGFRDRPSATERREVEQRSRSWIFLTPALLFIVGGLLVPLLRTIVLSFKDRDSAEAVGFANYSDVLSDQGFFSKEDWIAGNLLGSRLLWVAVAFVVLGVVVGAVGGARRRSLFDRGPGSVGPIAIGFFLAACLVFATLSGTVINNLWWVVVVTGLTTVFGLAVAVLADRAKGENIAKSLIFLPMAISFVGAGVIWTFVYATENVRNPQTGLLNAIWVGLGELSNADWQKWLVAAVLAAIILGLAALAWSGIQSGNGSRAGFSIGFALILALLLYMLLGPGIGGFETTGRGELRGTTIDFIREPRYNNMWLMVVLIWIQTGFAMVIFSSAIKAVPTELIEAAKIDGATESQVFWRVTLAQILPTVGVVVTTLIVTVMKVFDIVKVMTGGDFESQVIANQMIETINRDGNLGKGATLATLLFVAILPVMVYNIRNMQKAKG